MKRFSLLHIETVIVAAIILAGLIVEAGNLGRISVAFGSALASWF